MTFVFLPNDHESANERVARCAEEALAAGPMANTVRGSVYEAFLQAAYGNGKVARTIATSCAVFAGACCILAGVQDKRDIPKVRAITTWLGVPGFSGSWVPANAPGFSVLRGDIFYICSTSGKMGSYSWTQWEAAANGHVGILLSDGFLTRTAEGGGSPGGTGCRISEHPKDIRSLSHPLRGVWRPNNMPLVKTESSRTPELPIHPGTKGDGRVRAWQQRLQAAGYPLPKFGADDHFSTNVTSETGVATVQVQAAAGLPLTGIVDQATWDAAQPL